MNLGKKRKNKPTPSPTFADNKPKKHRLSRKHRAAKRNLKSYDSESANTEEISGESSEELLSDSLCYQDRAKQPCTDSINVDNSGGSDSVPAVMQGEGDMEEVMATQPPSQSLLQDHVARSSMTSPMPGVSVMPHPIMMMGGGMPVPMTPVPGAGFFGPGSTAPTHIVQNSLSDEDILRVALKVKSLMISEIDQLIKLKVDEATSEMKNDLQVLKNDNKKLKDDIVKLEKKSVL